jgi:DNA-directed RNA polymerase specialized sigma subunit
LSKDEIIKITDEWLKSVPDMKRDIRLIDIEIKKDIYEGSELDKLTIRTKNLNTKLNLIATALQKLDVINQRLICHKYFDKLTHKVIAIRVGYSVDTVSKKLKSEALLDLGRTIFGMEDEFWIDIVEGM